MNGEACQGARLLILHCQCMSETFIQEYFPPNPCESCVPRSVSCDGVRGTRVSIRADGDVSVVTAGLVGLNASCQ